MGAARRASKTHSGLIQTFTNIVRSDPDFPPEGGTVPNRLFDKRSTADYDWAHRKNWTESDAREAIAQAEWFVGEVAAWHDRNPSPGR